MDRSTMQLVYKEIDERIKSIETSGAPETMVHGGLQALKTLKFDLEMQEDAALEEMARHYVPITF